MSSKKTNSKKQETSKITTIKLATETKKRLEKLREHKRESYDDLLRKILFILNVTRVDPEKAKKILEKISEVRKKAQETDLKQKEY